MSSRKHILSISGAGTKMKVDPLTKFEAGIKSKQTLITYRKSLREFLDSVKEFDGTFEQKITQFMDFAMTNTEGTQDQIRIM